MPIADAPFAEDNDLGFATSHPRHYLSTKHCGLRALPALATPFVQDTPLIANFSVTDQCFVRNDCGQAAWQIQHAADDSVAGLVSGHVTSPVLRAQAPHRTEAAVTAHVGYAHFVARYGICYTVVEFMPGVTVMGKKTASKKKEGSKYAIWEKAKRERKARQKFCDELEKKYPSDDESVMGARRKLAEAIAKYDRIVAEL
jgi:hypothetical protein